MRQIAVRQIEVAVCAAILLRAHDVDPSLFLCHPAERANGRQERKENSRENTGLTILVRMRVATAAFGLKTAAFAAQRQLRTHACPSESLSFAKRHVE